MWTPEHRLAADRSGLRYPSDLTNAEWAIVEPWNFLHPVDGMPMEGAAERSAAKEYSARLSGAVELGWYVRAHPPRALCRGARAGRT